MSAGQPIQHQQQSKDIEQLLKEAHQYFESNNYQPCLQIYTKILAIPNLPIQRRLQSLQNRASLFQAQNKHKQLQHDLQQYLKINKKSSPQIYILYIRSLLKTNDVIKADQVCKESMEMYPYSKKLQDLYKECKQKTIADDEEKYVEKIFQKLCSHPKIREYMGDQSFLTKLERLIRNPSLSNALCKMDPRLSQVMEFILMAEENDD